MPASAWQKSSYCQEGSNCLMIAANPNGTISLRESSEPGSTLTTTAPALRGLVRSAGRGAAGVSRSGGSS
ncbi:DUF397 domain-containing protein [Streptomyces sp. MST-110588]|uniref:DUF397 domain-containing protein n=1 Tax=Streptomyces sp. MST-110588 TaxID=2833628 RepID=UPI001F5D9019|nr:DUF397 domain-containing protein [Streptomyces sp. MST-110588]UNO41221.1 DUF397 domain-containing protein [Streptomyces sp. MST-110588]